METRFAFHQVCSRLRDFFLSQNFIEVHPQSRRSILAACEDPTTIGRFAREGQLRPLPQTGQMRLEHELLNNPDVPGFFCVTTSYRQEPNPVPGRHETIFPMFEFETHGDMQALIDIETQLLQHLGFATVSEFQQFSYDQLATHYNTKELEYKHETAMEHDFSPVVFLTDFPQFTSPFRNMKKDKTHAKKVDVILYSMETIGSAERSCSVDEMRESFYTISDGMYAKTLFQACGKDRVEKELEEFFTYDFFPRCGGGIGMSRMISAMQKAGLFQPNLLRKEVFQYSMKHHISSVAKLQ